MQCRGHGNIVALSDIGLNQHWADIILFNYTNRQCIYPKVKVTGHMFGISCKYNIKRRELPRLLKFTTMIYTTKTLGKIEIRQLWPQGQGHMTYFRICL